MKTDPLSSLPDELAQLGRDYDKHLRTALNQSADEIRTEAIAGICAQIALPRSYVERNLFIKKRATINNPEAIIAGVYRPVLLTRYTARQRYTRAKTVTRKHAGVSVRVKAGGSRKTLRGAFFIELKNGALGVAVRTGKERGDYDVKHGPSVDQLWQAYINDNPDKMADVMETFLNRLARYE